MTALTWETFVVDLQAYTGLAVERGTRLEDLSAGPVTGINQLLLLAHLERIAGEPIEPELYESIETVEELWDWATVIAERRRATT